MARVLATSLIALLLWEGHWAYAMPSTVAGPTAAFDGVFTSGAIVASTSFSAPTGAFDYIWAPKFASIVSTPNTPTGRHTFTATSTGADASQETSLETISTISQGIVLEHARPGKLAGTSSRWTNSGGTSVFVGTTPRLALGGSSYGAASSASPGYSFSPISAGGVGGSMLTRSNDGKAAHAGAAFVPKSESRPHTASGSGPALSRSVQASLNNTPSRPVFAGGSGVGDTPVTNAALGPNSPITIEFNADLNISDSNLTIEGYAIAGTDPDSVNGANLFAGTVIGAGGALIVPITVVGTGPGDLTSNLTIFTNAGVTPGGGGEVFNYLLDPLVVISLSVSPAPEPASLAMLAAGLAGLASVCRRRRSR